jgi:hypothetical protein
MVKFEVQGDEYCHPFCVCKLATETDAILGTDFLLREGVTVDFDERKIFPGPGLDANPDPSSLQPDTVHQTQRRPEHTVFPTTVREPAAKACMIGYRLKEEEPIPKAGGSMPAFSVVESSPWLVKLNRTTQLAPRAKTMVLGHLDLPKHLPTPQLVCVEPAQLPRKACWQLVSCHACSAQLSAQAIRL